MSYQFVNPVASVAPLVAPPSEVAAGFLPSTLSGLDES